jgi:hypothetical protein
LRLAGRARSARAQAAPPLRVAGGPTRFAFGRRRPWSIDRSAVWLQIGRSNRESLGSAVSITPHQSHNCDSGKLLKFHGPESQKPRYADNP